MKKYYFIGGPKKGFTEEFFQRLGKIGGPPTGWKIYPIVKEKGKALHIVDAENEGAIKEHLRHFEGIYERGDIIEILEKK
jgi:hypothetical protein